MNLNQLLMMYIHLLPFFPELRNDQRLEVSELPEYLADVSNQVDDLRWWNSHDNNGRLPNWTSTCKKVNSSAAAECVFYVEQFLL